MENENKTLGEKRSVWANSWIPLAILLVGVMVSGSILYASGTFTPTPKTKDPADNVLPVTANDHIRGDINAPVKMVEFSDTECPYCKTFHKTMEQVMDKYGKNGQVAWVYRHYPIHGKSEHEAEALECAAELGGNDAFWKYTDRIFEVTPSNDGLDDEKALPEIAKFVGLDVDKFNTCLASGKHADEVAADMRDAKNTGSQGTPNTIIIAKNGEKYVIPGAYPFEYVDQIIQKALGQNQ